MTQTAFGDYTLDDDPGRVDLDALWTFLSTQAYWGRWRSRADVESQVRGAWRVVAAYDAQGRFAAFARAVSDGVTTAYLGDVFVLPQHRGTGLGVALVQAMVDDGPGAGLRWLLHTADAHGLYKRFGFAPPDRTMMERPRPEPITDEWEQEVAEVWAAAGELDEDEVVSRIEALAAQRRGRPEASFELACAYDYDGREPQAEPLYREAISAGLDDDREVRAGIQLASTLRNLGRTEEAIDLLQEEVPPRYSDAQAAFRALALLDEGRDREAAIVALDALAGRLPVYGRAVDAYVSQV